MSIPDPAKVGAMRVGAPAVEPLAGDELMMLMGMRHGAIGSTVGWGNVDPEAIAGIHRAFERGDLRGGAQAAAAHGRAGRRRLHHREERLHTLLQGDPRGEGRDRLADDAPAAHAARRDPQETRCSSVMRELSVL